MKTLPLLIFLLMPLATSADAEPWSDCIVGKYKRYAGAQEKWQEGLTQLIVEVAPGYAEAARLYMDKQLRSIERSVLAVEYLAQREPAKLRTHLSLNNWLSLSEGDRQHIATHSGRYAELLRLAEIERKQAPHPQGDELRTLMRTDIMNRAAYNQLIQAFSQAVEEIERIECQEKPNERLKATPNRASS